MWYDYHGKFEWRYMPNENLFLFRFKGSDAFKNARNTNGRVRNDGLESRIKSISQNCKEVVVSGIRMEPRRFAERYGWYFL